MHTRAQTSTLDPENLTPEQYHALNVELQEYNPGAYDNPTARLLHQKYHEERKAERYASCFTKARKARTAKKHSWYMTLLLCGLKLACLNCAKVYSRYLFAVWRRIEHTHTVLLCITFPKDVTIKEFKTAWDIACGASTRNLSKVGWQDGRPVLKVLYLNGDNVDIDRARRGLDITNPTLVSAVCPNRKITTVATEACMGLFDSQLNDLLAPDVAKTPEDKARMEAIFTGTDTFRVRGVKKPKVDKTTLYVTEQDTTYKDAPEVEDGDAFGAPEGNETPNQPQTRPIPRCPCCNEEAVEVSDWADYDTPDEELVFRPISPPPRE